MALKKRTDGNFLFCIYNRLNSTVSSNNKCFIFTLTGNKQAAPRLNSRNTIVQSCSVRPYFIVNIHTVYIMLNFIQRLRKVKMLIHSSEWHCHRLWKNFIYVNWSKCLLYKRLLLMPWKMSLSLSLSPLFPLDASTESTHVNVNYIICRWRPISLIKFPLWKCVPLCLVSQYR